MSTETESTHRSLISLRKLLLIHCPHAHSRLSEIRMDTLPLNAEYFHSYNGETILVVPQLSLLSCHNMSEAGKYAEQSCPFGIIKRE